MEDYSNSFTIDDLEKIIETNKNTVVTYPAGTGKTTAIVDYIVKYGDMLGKVIYIAPTQSLLDDLYDKLIKARVVKSSIFNYHSNSKDYLELVNRFGKEKSSLTRAISNRIDGAAIVLITHKRMLFEDASRFVMTPSAMLGGIADDRGIKVFIDEAVEPCIIAKINRYCLGNFLAAAELISHLDSPDDYKPGYIWDTMTKEYIPYPNKNGRTGAITRVFNAITRIPPKCTTYALPRPSQVGITLSDLNTGFEYKAKDYDDVIHKRLTNLYNLIAAQLVDGEFIADEDNTYVVNIPVALQLVWKRTREVQTIVMDATAEFTKSLYEDYEFYRSDDWNYRKLTNYVYHSNKLSKTKLIQNPDRLIKAMDTIDMSKYNHIYIVSCKSFLQQLVDYIQLKYPDYKLIYSIANPTELISDIDYSSDEVYFNSDIDPDTGLKYPKIIYLSNYGRTRGSNVFRDCDCVIQVGAYRIRPEVYSLIKMVFKELDWNDLTLANWIQELYRGKIRCDKPMDSYSIIDEDLYNSIIERIPSIEFIDRTKWVTSKSVNASFVNREVYGRHSVIVAKLYKAKEDGRTLHKADLFEIFDSDQLNNIRRSILRLYNKHLELRKTLFNNYESEENLAKALTTDKYTDLNFIL